MTSDNTVSIIYISTLAAWGLGVLLYCLTAYFRTLPVAVTHHHHHHHHHHRRHDESPRPVREPIPLRRAGTPAIPHLASYSDESEPEEIFMANTRTREEGEEREVAIALGATTPTTLLPSRSASYHPHTPTPSEIVRHYNLQTSPTYRTNTTAPPSGNHHWTAPPTIRISTASSDISALRWGDPVPTPVSGFTPEPSTPTPELPTDPWVDHRREAHRLFNGLEASDASRAVSGSTNDSRERLEAVSGRDYETSSDSSRPGEQSHPLTLHANRHIEFPDTASTADVASFYSAQPQATPWYTTTNGRGITDDRSEQQQSNNDLDEQLSIHGRVMHIAVILWEASFLDLFKHFIQELPLTATWLLGAGRTYTYAIANGLDAQEQLSDEAGRFTVNLWNQLHPDDPREVEVQAQEPHPMPDAPPQRRHAQYAPPPGPPPRVHHAPRIPQYAPPPGPPPHFQLPQGYGPPGQYSQGNRFFAGGGQGAPGGGAPAGGAAAAAQNGWPLPRHPSPPGPPGQPGPWPLADGHTAPYDALKPTILREVQPFKGESGDIRCFFSQCEMHFSLYNNYLRHHPHKVVFCISHFEGDAQEWWNTIAENMGRDANDEQLFPSYTDFKAWTKARFWQDADARLKKAAWQRLRQSDFKDGDLFFQKFEQLAAEAGVAGDELMMLDQIEKAARATSKTAIFTAASAIPTDYPQWKARLLQLDYNYRISRTSPGDRQPARNDTRPQQKNNVPRGNTTYTPQHKTGTGTTYGGQGQPMDIDRMRKEGRCFRCGKKGHMKPDCKEPDPKARVQAVTTEPTTESKVEEVKDEAEE
ncbi:hypothetical protein EDD85DRAFT_944929 [Armillaria nabsnona]|nr:hypothetical protein EDD85DRAFT_944929 [Armillaria nabsnona]